MNLNRGSYCFLALLIGLLVLGMGCARKPNDSQSGDEIRAKFKQDSGLQDKSISVQVVGGVVTISGVVGNDVERTAAAHYASMAPGIREVINNIQVKTASPELGQNVDTASSTPPPAPSEPETNPRPNAPRRQEAVPSAAKSGRKPSSTAKDIRPSAREDQIADASSTSTENTQPAPELPPAPEAPAPRPDYPSAPAPNLASAPASDPKMMTIEAGTTMAIRLLDGIDSETAQQGQTFRATLDSPLSVEWDVAIPSGYTVEGHVAEVKSAGKFAGQSELVLTLDRILVHDKSYDIQTDEYRRKGKNQSTNTAEKVGVGAAIGAIIGGIAGGGKGAGIGAAAGGGLGARPRPPARVTPSGCRARPCCISLSSRL